MITHFVGLAVDGGEQPHLFRYLLQSKADLAFTFMSWSELICWA